MTIKEIEPTYKYTCDNCGKVEIVDQNHYSPERLPDDWAFFYVFQGPHLTREAQLKKSKHYCPNCVEKRK